MLLRSRSYSERSNWVELLTGIGILYYYAHWISRLPGTFESNPSEFGALLIKLIIASIVLSIIYSIIFGLAAKNDKIQEDERDRQIRQKATSWAYWLMNIGIVYLIVQLFINALLRNYSDGESVDGGLFLSVSPIDFMLHGLIILCFICQIMQNLSEIVLQRKGG